jgi:hypothetical protein
MLDIPRATLDAVYNFRSLLFRNQQSTNTPLVGMPRRSTKGPLDEDISSVVAYGISGKLTFTDE